MQFCDFFDSWVWLVSFNDRVSSFFLSSFWSLCASFEWKWEVRDCETSFCSMILKRFEMYSRHLCSIVLVFPQPDINISIKTFTFLVQELSFSKVCAHSRVCLPGHQFFVKMCVLSGFKNKNRTTDFLLENWKNSEFLGLKPLYFFRRVRLNGFNNWCSIVVFLTIHFVSLRLMMDYCRFFDRSFWLVAINEGVSSFFWWVNFSGFNNAVLNKDCYSRCTFC